jgi:hypothetical protein
MTTSNPVPSVSRRTALVGLGAGSLGLALATLPAAAHESMPAAMAGHPLVGTWFVTIPGFVDTLGPSLNVYTADGVVSQLDPSRGHAMGAWEATGERAGVVTLLFLNDAAGGTTVFESFGVVRHLIEADATGDTFVGQGEVEWRAFDGTKSEGPYGPYPVDGKRVRAETTFALVTAASPAATPTT